MAVTTINAIMRMRRGFESDLDISKLQVGEWALSTDTKFVRICYAPNKVVQIASQETMDATLAEIQQVFEQTIEEVESDVATVEEYMGTTLIYKNAAAASASEASASATTAGQQATASTNSSKDSEAWAVGTRNGQEVPPTDPAYHNNSKYWAQQVAANTLAGLEDVTITGVSDGQTLKYDESSQEWVNVDTPDATEKTAIADFSTVNGGLLSSLKVALTPNQDLHGYSEPWVGGAGKNKVPYFTSSTVSGRVWTVSDDGIITITGTSTGNSYKVMNITLPAGTYQLSGGDPNGVSGTGDEYVQVDGVVVARSYGNTNQTFTLSEEKTVTLALRDFQTAGNSDTHVFKPMICLTSAVNPLTYEPYENICPISGHTQAKLEQRGKNYLNSTLEDKTASGITYTKLSDGIYNVNGTSTTNGGADFAQNITLPAGTYKILGLPNGVASNSCYIGLFKDGAYYATSREDSFTLTEATTFESLRFRAGIGNSFDNVIVKPMITKDLSATYDDYEPYQGKDYIVNLGGTYYSGTLDMVSGVFVVDKVGKDMTTITDWNINTSAQRIYKVLSDIKPTSSGTEIPNLISNRFKALSVNDIYSYVQGVAVSTGSALQFHINGLTDRNDVTLAEVNQWFVDNPTLVVYELATPQSIQLSPTMVKALVGDNNLSTPLDGQEIDEVKYKELFTYDDVTKLVEQEVKKKVPDAPTTDGTYTLKATVSSGAANYSWVSES